jgi:hypothetical protein
MKVIFYFVILSNMAEKHKIVLTIKQMPTLIKNFWNRLSETKLAKDYGIGIQTVCDIKDKVKLMEFIRDCDNGAEPSNPKRMKKSSYEETSVAFQCFNQNHSEGTSVCAQKANFFIQLRERRVILELPLDGW